MLRIRQFEEKVAKLIEEGKIKSPCHLYTYNYYVIRSTKRDKLEEYLKSKGIETMVSWRIPNHKQLMLNLDFNLPMTERSSNEVLSLPMYPELTDEQVEYVIKTVNEWQDSQ